MSKTKRKPTVLQALFPILAMLIILGVGIAFLDLPAEPLIVLAAVVSGVQAIFLGYSYDDIMNEIANKIAKVWGCIVNSYNRRIYDRFMDARRHYTYAYLLWFKTYKS